jgi:hypothetical protein
MFEKIAQDIVKDIDGASYEPHKAVSGSKGPREKFVEAIDDQIALYQNPEYKRKAPGKKDPVSPNKWFSEEGSKVRIQPRYGNARFDKDYDIVVPKDKVIAVLEKLKEAAENKKLDDLLEQKAEETRPKKGGKGTKKAA